MLTTLTVEEVRNSPIYKELVTGRVSLIHNTYWDSRTPMEAYIVIHSDMGKWTITSFWKSPKSKGEKLFGKNDYVNISTDEVFALLLKEYSTGLQ